MTLKTNPTFKKSLRAQKLRDAGKTNKQIAKTLGISESYASRLARGRDGHDNLVLQYLN